MSVFKFLQQSQIEKLNSNYPVYKSNVSKLENELSFGEHEIKTVEKIGRNSIYHIKVVDISRDEELDKELTILREEAAEIFIDYKVMVKSKNALFKGKDKINSIHFSLSINHIEKTVWVEPVLSYESDEKDEVKEYNFFKQKVDKTSNVYTTEALKTKSDFEIKKSSFQRDGKVDLTTIDNFDFQKKIFLIESKQLFPGYKCIIKTKSAIVHSKDNIVDSIYFKLAINNTKKEIWVEPNLI